MNEKKLRTCLLISLLCFATIATLYSARVTADDKHHEDEEEWKMRLDKKTGFILYVEPSDVSISPGGKAEFSVMVESLGPPYGYPDAAKGMTYLTLRGVPRNAVGIFTPQMGLPTFKSELTIITHPDVNPGLYGLTIVAVNKKSFGVAEVALMIQGESEGVATTSTATTSQTTLTTTETTSTAEVEHLNVVFSTDKLSYSGGESVLIEGIVTDPSQNAVSDAGVSIEVEDPLGSAAHIYQTSTDPQGFFNDTFTIPDDAVNGTYTAYVTATYQGQSGIAHSTFTVGESGLPSISILSLNVTANGVQATSIEPGTEVLASVEVLNSGADLEGGMVWLEVDDPRDVPIYITMLSTSMNQGSPITVEFHVFLEADAVEGVYTANAYVSNGYISQGGVFLDGEQSLFIVEAPLTTTTTTATSQTSNTTTTPTNTTTTTKTTINSTTATNTTTPITTTETTSTSITLTTTETNETTTSTLTTTTETSITTTATTSESTTAETSTTTETEST